MKIKEAVQELQEQGYDRQQIIDFLEDGEAMKNYGIDDDQQEEIEEMHDWLNGKKQYRIYSIAGEFMGTYAGRSKSEALASMHREAGYDVADVDGSLVFADDDDRAVCGGWENWIIEEVA